VSDRSEGAEGGGAGDGGAADQFERRAFLKTGLGAAGIAALAAGGFVGLRPSRPEGYPPTPGAQPGVPALTVNGQLVEVPGPPLLPAGLPRTDPSVRRGEPGRKWVMVIDLAACDGCGECATACNEMHDVPADQPWLRIYKMQDSPAAAPYWLPRPCFHCDDPPCTKVCPVDGTFKREDGIVLVDSERCIGCRFCMAACPFSARVFNWERPTAAASHAAAVGSPETGQPRRIGTVSKCDFCPEMAREGKLPACVTSCDMGAIYFGDEMEDAVTNGDGQTLRFSQLLQERAGYRHLEKLGTKPRVYYLPPARRRYPPPEMASTSPDTHHADAAPGSEETT
jgi:Fe-S-cluster-containing dehydrogenase component